jgi:hypothetical protein
VQAGLDVLIRHGMGLVGCWIAMVAFQAIRLVANSACLLRPGSVLSRTTPLPDALEDMLARIDVDYDAALAAEVPPEAALQAVDAPPA